MPDRVFAMINNKMAASKELLPTNEEFEAIDQRGLVQGVVVDIVDDQVRFVATHVLDGRDDILNDNFYPEFRTATTFSPYFSEIPHNYRALWDELNDQRTQDPRSWNDRVDIDGETELTPGDIIHVHQTIFWEPEKPKGGQTGHYRFDVCKLPVPNIGLDATIEQITIERRKKIEEALGVLSAAEQVEMSKLERVVAGLAVRPFTDQGRHDPDGKNIQVIRSKLVYGEGPVEDHFVIASASTAIEMDLEYGGVRRFGVDGSQFIVPAIMPFGHGSEDDPLYELRVKLTSQTKLNPAVGEVRPVVLIDGVKYEALIDPEQSIHAR